MLYEFYNSPTGDVMITSDCGTSPFRNVEREVVQELLSTIRACYADAFKALEKEYASSARNRPFYEYKIVHRFIRCNCGNFDTMKMDYEDGLFALEQVPCPMRGCNECRMENIVCNPRRTSVLTSRQIQVAQLLAEGLSNGEVADRLYISVNTVHVLVAQIKNRLGVKNARQIINYINSF